MVDVKIKEKCQIQLHWVLVYCTFVVGMEIGQRVKVYRLRDRVSNAVAQRLGKTGIIQGYKITDGAGVGVVVLFDDNFSTWFFEDELKLAWHTLTPQVLP